MPAIFLDYTPAELKKNKLWYDSFYLKNPDTGHL